jgi:hypothetical protein
MLRAFGATHLEVTAISMQLSPTTRVSQRKRIVLLFTVKMTNSTIIYGYVSELSHLCSRPFMYGLLLKLYTLTIMESDCACRNSFQETYILSFKTYQPLPYLNSRTPHAFYIYNAIFSLWQYLFGHSSVNHPIICPPWRRYQ